MNRARFIMVGGFLGAGKTTTLARLARFYMSRGQRIGVVTNDQAQNLVDTNNLRSQGLPVEEVSGACFCCRFDDLIGRVERLALQQRPDVILAEPVGSCTDLVATVVQPLKDLYRDRFEVAPYAVLFKPSQGLRMLRNDPGTGFSEKAAYILRKQLEEADAIAINRLDELSAAETEELARLLNQQYPGIPVLLLSARTGQGFEALTRLLDEQGSFGGRILDIDYDTYAEGEAEMGWLNSSILVRAASAFDLDSFLLEVVGGLQARLGHHGGGVAHLKVLGLCDGAFAVANLVDSAKAPELSVASNARADAAEVIVNARVAVDPGLLEATVQEVVRSAIRSRGGQTDIRKTQCLRPGRPVPTHRYANAL